MADHYVSPSALGDFRKCRKCFWLDRNRKIRRPRGAFPTLPGGIDRVMKAYFDVHRAAGTMPPEIVMHVPTGAMLYQDTAKLEAMRNARKPLLTSVIGNVKLVGGIDDLLTIGDAVAPFDVKTKGRALMEDADPFEWYRMQMNDYGLLLKAFGFKLFGKAYLGYWAPSAILDRHDEGEDGTQVLMPCQVFSMDLDLDAARAEVIEAGKCLDGKLPEPDPGCEMCAYIGAVNMESA